MENKEISIVIPTRNRKRKLEKCLNSIFSQNYPIDKYEVIVVDDNSNDGTFVAIERFKEKYSNLNYIKLTRRNGPAKARNVGISYSSGKIIFFTDSDCILLEENLLKKLYQGHLAFPDRSVIGGVTYSNPILKSEISQFISNKAIKTQVNSKEKVIFFPTCNISVKREVVESEKFDERFQKPGGEDLEFCWRLYKKGCSFLYDNNIKIYHNLNGSFLNFLIQPYIYGKENLLVKKIHPEHPALKDIRLENFFKFMYFILKEFIKVPILSIRLWGKFCDRRGNFFLVVYYFMIFRFMYLLGVIIKYIKN